ncbi:AraC family transcriptional regulator [Flavobacterium sp. LS1R49]|uniref:AraC family transcriptional regulator n=1 Tax=Flavobacterium shii TaxID=2987687 RepID=A0A9X2ZGK8_9FLAO|nr:AraC family transcriptional regulator [Flavobacterium shii]MCV9927338.1 AraC family transcriptional regulator [Flavobacterium shii]
MSTNNWAKHIQKFLFLLKDEFFEFPYLSNSPQVMVDSLIKIPVIKHKPLQQLIYSDNPFWKGTMRYREIESGFWILETNIELKQNIIAKATYDEDHLRDYYILSFSVFEYKYPIKDSEDVTLLSTCWTFYKPETEVATYFYKGTKGKFFNLAISKEWVTKNIKSSKIYKKNIDDFFNTQKGFYTWLDVAPNAHILSKSISDILEADNEIEFNAKELKKNCVKLIDDFFDNAFHDSRIPDNVSLSNLDYYNVAKAEKMILHNLHVPFVGIEHIAFDVNTSPTKLKSNFKTVFGFSLLQYHKEKNMLLAKQLLEKTDVEIQTISVITGYESASKFAAAFKKRFGKLPSAYRDERFTMCTI